MHVGHRGEPTNSMQQQFAGYGMRSKWSSVCVLLRMMPSWASGNLLSVQVLEPSAWATMLAVIWLHANGKELKCEWELLERKAVVWLHNNAGRSTAPTPFLSPFGSQLLYLEAWQRVSPEAPHAPPPDWELFYFLNLSFCGRIWVKCVIGGGQRWV